MADAVVLADRKGDVAQAVKVLTGADRRVKQRRAGHDRDDLAEGLWDGAA